MCIYYQLSRRHSFLYQYPSHIFLVILIHNNSFLVSTHILPRFPPTFPPLSSNPFADPTHLFSTPPGIVTTAAKDLLPLLYSHIRLLRFYGCTLPVEIFISRQIDGAVNETEVKAFAAVNASISDIDDFVPTSLTVSAREHPTRPFIMKHLAIVSSSCEECIFLDADNMPVRDLRYLFDDVHYHEAGLLLWPDFWHFPPNGHSYIREIFDDNDTESSSWLPRRDIRTVESGQMVVNKRKSWKSLMLATFMQVQTLFYDNLVKGGEVSKANIHPAFH